MRYFKTQKVSMPKHGSGRVHEWALVLNTGLHNSKPKIKFLKCMYLNFDTFTFLNPSSRKKNIMGSISWDESFISKHCHPGRVVAAADITFSEHLWRKAVLQACLVFRTERLWRTSCHPPRLFFILNPKDLNFSGRLLSFPSTGDYCNYHACSGQ